MLFGCSSKIQDRPITEKLINTLYKEVTALLKAHKLKEKYLFLTLKDIIRSDSDLNDLNFLFESIEPNYLNYDYKESISFNNINNL